MIDISKGRYWDKPWSLVDGCKPCSPGCDHCWSAAMTKRFHSTLCLQMKWIDAETGKTMSPAFNGDIITHHYRLSIPMKRRKPTVYAVWNDLFHKDVPVNFLEDALAIMTNCPQHIFLVLTKRAQRLNLMTSDRLRLSRTDTWPIKNLWLGITICNQDEANAKIPVFLQVPGKKFLSIEPMLGAVDLMELPRPFEFHQSPYGWQEWFGRNIHAVILGGETGPGARPMHPDWVRSVRDQCAVAGVPFFFKGWGDTPHLAWGPVRRGEWKKQSFRLLDGRMHDDLPWGYDLP